MAGIGPGRPWLSPSATRRFFITFRDLHYHPRASDCSRASTAKGPIAKRIGNSSTSCVRSDGHSTEVRTQSLRDLRPIFKTQQRYYHGQSKAPAREENKAQKYTTEERSVDGTSKTKVRSEPLPPKSGLDTTDPVGQEDFLQGVRQDGDPARPLGPILSAVDHVFASLSGEHGNELRQGKTPDSKEARQIEELRRQSLFEDLEAKEPPASQSPWDKFPSSTRSTEQDFWNTLKKTPVKPSATATYAGDRLTQIMRKFQQGLAIITSWSQTKNVTGADNTVESLKGMTLSSVDTVTMKPVPFLSFNSKLPSTTFEAIVNNPNHEFTMHIPRGVYPGAQLAHSFATGSYTEDTMDMLRLQAERAHEDSKRPPPRPHQPTPESTDVTVEDGEQKDPADLLTSDPMTSYPENLRQAENSVFATLFCRLHPDKCVSVGDHMVAVAEVTHVYRGKRFRGAGGGSLYYFNRGYYGHYPGLEAIDPEHDEEKEQLRLSRLDARRQQRQKQKENSLKKTKKAGVTAPKPASSSEPQGEKEPAVRQAIAS